jgi:predicted ATPase
MASPSNRATLHFTGIRLRNWRNFLDIDVPLQQRVFLVGPNASGKSNFLDAFRFLSDIVTVGGGFQEAVVINRGGISRLRCLSARRVTDIVVQVRIGSADGKPEWEYELHFSQDSRSNPIVKKEIVFRRGERILNRPDDDPEDSKDPARLTQTYLEQINANREFRDIAEFFASVRYLHLVPQLVRDPDRSLGRRNDPYGGDFLETVAQTPIKRRSSHLKRIRNALKVAVPQLAEIELTRDKRGGPHLRGRYEHWRPHGAWQTEDQFSDGTLRLMGLLWSAIADNGPLLLEEPELSLHPEVVRFIPQMFARIQRKMNRQIITSTHSSDLLRDEGIGLDEVLLLQPGENGTIVRSAKDFDEIHHLLNGGLSLAEAVLPMTRPQNAEQLTLFGDL